MSIGYALGWTSAILPKLEDEDQSPLQSLLSESEASLIGSLIYVGAMTAPIITTNLANTKGRKPCLILSGILNILAYILLALSTNLAMIFVGRVIVGSAVGTLLIMNVVYIGEIASTKIRGILLSGAGVAMTAGTILTYSTGPFITYAATAYLGLILSLCFLLSLYFIPESPIFYSVLGDDSKAKEVLQTLGRVQEMDVVLTSKEYETNYFKQEWKILFTVKDNRRALFITASLQILQEASGILAVVFFSTNIFKLASSSIAPDIATIIIGMTQLVGSLIAPLIIEKSRRILLLLSTALCSLSLALLGAYFYLDGLDYEFITKIQWLPLATLILYFLAYNMGFSVIPSTLAGEMFQLNVRNVGSTFVIFCGWLCGFGVTSAFGYMVTELGGDITFWIFSGTCAIAFFFTIFYVPETKGQTLTQIQKMLSERY
ncbi:unnamed protein product [Parnassius mnemosyne]|uniref:Major facilitator superfamily (MFS) profile domain-containing protein n=1 Tax=Parnassius mnemosyne TaxID=213953 RepID=A0AAV1LK85_9NEOP